jgi:hypothetical protein
MKTSALLVCALTLLTLRCTATPFENGDFQKGKSHWQGNGNVVYLNADGSVSETEEPGTTPAIEVKLNSNDFKELRQSFTTAKGEKRLGVSITYKGSADFEKNDKSTLYTPGNTWTDGGIWYWSALVAPKVDLCIRLDTPTGHCYKLAKVDPGGNWQTKTVTWDNVPGDQEVTLFLEVAPGKGSVLIKSLTVTPQ